MTGPGFGFGSGQVRVGVQGLSGLGFSEQVTVLTLLSHPVFSHEWRAYREEQWQDKQHDGRTMSLKGMEYSVMLSENSANLPSNSRRAFYTN